MRPVLDGGYGAAVWNYLDTKKSPAQVIFFVKTYVDLYSYLHPNCFCKIVIAFVFTKYRK